MRREPGGMHLRHAAWEEAILCHCVEYPGGAVSKCDHVRQDAVYVKHRDQNRRPEPYVGIGKGYAGDESVCIVAHICYAPAYSKGVGCKNEEGPEDKHCENDASGYGFTCPFRFLTQRR